MTNNQISIILEIISFFLITTDLYGEEKIQKLHEYFESKLFSLKAIDITDKFMRKKYTKFFIIGFSTILIVFSEIAFLWEFFQKFNFSIVNDLYLFKLVLLFISILLFYYTYPLLNVFFSYLTRKFFYTLETLLDSIIEFQMFILKKNRAKGFLISLGALIFLISKYLAF